MNETIIGADFDFAAKNAIALNVIFVTLVYCSGMPALLGIAALSLRF